MTRATTRSQKAPAAPKFQFRAGQSQRTRPLTNHDSGDSEEMGEDNDGEVDEEAEMSTEEGGTASVLKLWSYS